MTKVYPRAGKYCTVEEEKKQLVKSSTLDDASSVQLTVWKKSLLLNCNGFTVYDATGNLVYRVDNYGTRAHDIFLMDASGNSIFTIRRKRLSLGDNWMVFKGETATNPLFTAKKNINLLNGKSLAHVNSSLAYADCMKSCSTSLYQQQQQQQQGHSKMMMKVTYEIQGSYAQRCCVVYNHTTRRRVAEVRRKDSTVGGICLGLDVFRLVILQPNEIDSASAMAFVILLDQMFAEPPSTSR